MIRAETRLMNEIKGLAGLVLAVRNKWKGETIMTAGKDAPVMKRYEVTGLTQYEIDVLLAGLQVKGLENDGGRIYAVVKVG